MTTPQQTKCYDALMLKRLLEEQLQGTEESEVLAHIETCETCRDQLGQIAGHNQLEPEIREHFANESFDGPGAATVLEGEAEEGDIEQIRSLLGPTDDPHMLGRVGHYEINAIVGRGSTGIVFKAMDKRLNRFVAIKMLAPSYAGSGPARQRFEREARSIAAVRDEHVIPVFAVDEHKGLPFIVMEYMPGGSLAQRIERNGALDTCEVVRLGMQIARALEAAHGQGIVHRDVKPANVLIQSGVERALVTDFGLARILDEASMTRSGAISGTPQFMSPEQASGESVDHRSDLFSLGSVMYMACTGHSPFRSETVFGVIKRVCETEPRPIRETNPKIRQWLCDLIQKLHAKDANDRFQSAKEVGDVLAAELAYLQSPTSVPKPDRTWRPVTATALVESGIGKRVLSTVVGVAFVSLAIFGLSQLPFGQTESGEAAAVKGAVPPTVVNAPQQESAEQNIDAPALLANEQEMENAVAVVVANSDFDKAMEKYNEEEYDEAIELFKASIVSNEQVEDSAYNIACCFALMGEADEAFPWLDKAVKAGYCDTDHLQSDDDLKVLRKDKRFETLVTRMKEVEQADTLTSRGIHLRQQGRYEEANEIYAEVLSKYPNHEEAIVELGLSLHMQGNLDEAIKWHRRAAETENFDQYGNYNIACYHALKGQPDTAFEYFEKAIQVGMLDIQHFEQDSDLDSIRKDPRYQQMLDLTEKELRKKWSKSEVKCYELITAVRKQNYGELARLLEDTKPNCSCPNYRDQRNPFTRPRQTPLSVAARFGDLKAVKLIVGAGADADFMPNWEPRPVMEAAKNGHKEVAAFLLERGANVNSNIPGSGTPLSYAAAGNQPEMIRFLLSEGAKVNSRSDGVGTPLMAAARVGAMDSVRLLLDQNAELKMKVAGVGTALLVAARENRADVLKLLLDRGAEIDAKVDGVGTPLMAAIHSDAADSVQFLIDNGASINSAVAGAGTALSVAASNGKHEMMKLLLTNKANLNGWAHGVGTALCGAARNDELEAAELLLEAGANPDKSSDGVGTPLACAVRNHKSAMVKLLLKYDADPSASSPGTKSALAIASDRDDEEMLKLLDRTKN